ncbi:hypothetical protein A1O3_02844 [Capronia epimyces CBS 606.96]|uniref:Xylanolytic transcriptional activator regulatory domain-containing protein n=1 Tax=Capronia epimyces CBS 606.96 TaxID=1182542 RepID=W9YA98_9EURO|nr:uncharacterized protein A1O3_02844 [Capronia epimyces CBS 606.96]EXJ89777.1 hypothetical protein A1O3_02844 [Capronia epimyces CBS 606.96]
MSHKDHSFAPSVRNVSSEATSFEHISSDAKSGGKHRSLRVRAKAGKGPRAFPSSPHQVQEPARLKGREAIPIHHLLNAPEGDGFTERFPIRDHPEGPVGEEDETTMGEAEDSSEASHWSEDYEPNDVFIGAEMPDFDTAFDSFLGGIETMTFGSFPLQHDLSQVISGGEVSSPTALSLEPRAFEIRQLLIGTASRYAMEYPEDPNTPHLGPAIQRLTHTEIDHCINLYFTNYHPHCPILHRPSFRPTVAPIPLLLTTAALGAMYSPDPGKVVWMKSLFDVMEVYIFGLPGLRDEAPGSFMLTEAPDEETLDYQFQVFQGAYLMVVMQFFSGNLAGRRRSRRQRFCTILSIARSFGLPTAQHARAGVISDETSFQRWVRNETRIRTMNIILALDSGMGIFHNVPPRVSFGELDLQLPCHPEYFDLASYAEMLQRSLCPHPRMKLIDAFQRLFTQPDELMSAYQPETLCCWDMLYLIHVLFTYCWQHLLGTPLNRLSPATLGSVPSHLFEPMKTALTNWKTLWDEARASLSRSAVREIGFETSADSYWTLTRLIVQKFEAATENVTESRTDSGSGGGSGSGIQGRDPPIMASTGYGGGIGTSRVGLDFMPLQVDCDSQGAHLRRILGR